MRQKLYTVGEFAKLCGVSRHTLYHYDEIGVLVPSASGPNGYRLYALEQLERFFMIKTLQELKAPLAEIKSYLEEKDPGLFIALLKQKRKGLIKEQRRLEEMNALLQTAIADLESSSSLVFGQIDFVECPAVSLLVTSLPSPVRTEEEALKGLHAHIRYCAQRALCTSLHLGEIVAREDAENGLYRESAYFTKIHRGLTDRRVRLRPAGLYAVSYHRGGYSSLAATYESFCRDIKARGYRLDGDIYEEDVIDFYSEPNPDSYVMRIAAPVAKI